MDLPILFSIYYFATNTPLCIKVIVKFICNGYLVIYYMIVNV